MKVAGPVPDTGGLLNSQIIVLDTVLNIINIGLLMILIYLFLSSYINQKSKSNTIILLLAILLLFQNILMLIILFIPSFLQTPSTGMPSFVLNLTETMVITYILIIKMK
jgi:hypothetical protein